MTTRCLGDVLQSCNQGTWGNNIDCAIGCGVDTAGGSSEIGCVAVEELALGVEHSCALLSNGHVRCWGSNELLQLGAPMSITSSVIPLEVPGITTATAISAGFNHTCVRVTGGGVYCWGDNRRNQTAPSMQGTNFIGTPVLVTNNVFALAEFKFNTSCAVLNTGGVQCWGRRLGAFDPDPGDYNSVELLGWYGPGNRANHIVLGSYHACVDADVGLNCFGDGSAGQQCNGATVSASPPGSTDGVERPLALGLGDFITCFRATGVQNLECCGTQDVIGGQGPYDLRTAMIGAPPTTIPDATLVGAGFRHVCARTNGTVTCFGSNNHGQCGQNPSVSPVNPSVVSGFISLSNVRVGWEHNCAVDGFYTVKCWGSNNKGQTGVAPPGAPCDCNPTPVTVMWR